MLQDELKDPYLDQIIDAYNLDMQKMYREAIEHSRYLSLVHCAREIYDHGIEGSVAEAGVYRGYFAQYINQVFPDRMLHLYDTFEGFPAGDINYDKVTGFLSGKHDLPLFSLDNDIDSVKALMEYPDKCIFHVGRIPETYDWDSTEMFCFVSIDCDIHLPTISSLEYFYLRMVSGGYIFLHDYNHGAGDFYGIREAVVRYENMYNIDLKYVPLSDFSGTLVIVK